MSRFYTLALSIGSVQPDQNVIHGVSLISKGAAKGHDVMIDDKCLEQIDQLAQLQGNVKVKADHGSGVLSTIGYLDNFKLLPDKVTGDLHIYESEPERARIYEIAAKNPSHLGISLEFSGEDQRKGGVTYARCSELFTAALVSDPAANRSLFSAKPVDTKNLGMADDIQKTDDTSKQDPKGNPMEALSKKFDEFMSRYEADRAVSKDEMSRYGARLSKFEDVDKEGTEKGGQPPVVDPTSEPVLLDPKKDKSIDEVAEMAALKVTKLFASRLGINLPASPVGAGQFNKKTFEQLVEEKTTELKDRSKAMIFCLENHKAEYALSRKVAPR